MKIFKSTLSTIIVFTIAIIMGINPTEAKLQSESTYRTDGVIEIAQTQIEPKGLWYDYYTATSFFNPETCCLEITVEHPWGGILNCDVRVSIKDNGAWKIVDNGAVYSLTGPSSRTTEICPEPGQDIERQVTVDMSCCREARHLCYDFDKNEPVAQIEYSTSGTDNCDLASPLDFIWINEPPIKWWISECSSSCGPME